MDSTTLETHLADLREKRSAISGTKDGDEPVNEVGVAENLDALIERHERALAKIEEGTYGTCDRCEKPIPAARLEAQPESVYCVECIDLMR